MSAKSDRTSPETVAFILDQLRDAGAVRARQMFGGYGLYCDDRIVGVVCADQLFIKPTPEGAALEPSLERAPAYDGAKPSMVVSAELLEDRDRLTAFVRVTAAGLPAPKPRKPRSAKA